MSEESERLRMRARQYRRLSLAARDGAAQRALTRIAEELEEEAAACEAEEARV